MFALVPAPPTLAASGNLFFTLAPWLAGLLALVVVGGAAILLVRRMLRGDPPSGGEGFSLQELRDLHAAGRISDEQFERARASIIGRYTPKSAPEDPRRPTP